MEGEELIRKKTGMTIGNAWLLMLFSMLFVLVFGYLLGLFVLIYSVNVSSGDLVDYSAIGLSISFLIFSIIGFFINKKEFPKFLHVSRKSWIMCICLALLWSFLSCLLLEFYEVNNEMYNQRKITNTWWFGLILSSLMVIFQIGIIGHGLLGNYNFKKAFVAISFVCIAFYIPVAVVSMVFQTGLLFFIYYRTGSFLVVLACSWSIYLSDHLVRKFYHIEKFNFNYYREAVFDSDFTYYMVCLLAVCSLLFCLIQLKKLKLPIQWRKDNDYQLF